MADDFNIEEVSLVIFLLDKEAYNKYYSYLSKLNLEQETKSFLKTISEFFKENPQATNISVPEFMTYFSVKHPVLKKRTAYSWFLSKLGDALSEHIREVRRTRSIPQRPFRIRE